MAANARLTKAINVAYNPAYIIANWTGRSVPPGGSEFFTLELPGPLLSDLSYISAPDRNLEGYSYSIAVNTFAVSCLSTNFDVQALDINDITKFGTVNEVFKYEGENLVFKDNELYDYVIKNQDTPQLNRFYILITNYGAMATGTMTFELVYTCLQDRL